MRYNSLQHNSKLQQSNLWRQPARGHNQLPTNYTLPKKSLTVLRREVLLADEVGLVKPISTAGLFFTASYSVVVPSRILLMVPETLQHQWLVEMRRRFNLDVALFDAERFQASDADNPFEDCQIALLSMNWLVADERAQQALCSCDWDILVVDEAHHLVWHPEQSEPSLSAG